ncbi:MAG: biotin/lipoyl-containing protein, partial [Pseudomonadota bacterium]
RLAQDQIDDVLTYALFPQVGLKFLENRDNPAAFEPAPGEATEVASNPKPVPSSQVDSSGPQTYEVRVNGKPFTVEVNPQGAVTSAVPAKASAPAVATPGSGAGEPVTAALAGNVFKVLIAPGQVVQEGETVLILEAMKMETEVSAPRAGTVGSISISEGDAVQVGDSLFELN